MIRMIKQWDGWMIRMIKQWDGWMIRMVGSHSGGSKRRRRSGREGQYGVGTGKSTWGKRMSHRAWCMAGLGEGKDSGE